MTQIGRIPIAIVGLSFGRHIINLLGRKPAASLFELKGVCDLRTELADSLARELDVKAFHSMDDLLEDPSIKAVGLFTTPFCRADLIRKILRAGKDVLTTKPFELDSEEAASVLREAQSLGRTIHLNSPGPDPTAEIRQIEQWGADYNLGALVSAYGEAYASYQEQADGSWMDDPARCPGGSMMRLGIYLINDILHLAGIPDSVHLLASRVRTGRPTPDNALLTFAFPSGCLGSVYTSFCVKDGDQYSNGLSLHFENGSIYRNVGGTRLVSQGERSHLSLVRLGANGRTVEEKVFTECSGIYQWRQFYDACTNQSSLSEEYLQRIVEGIRVLESIRYQSTTPSARAEKESALLAGV